MGEREDSRARETPDPGADDEVDELRDELEALRERIDEKTVHRDDIRAELRRYVRKRQRRGHATGWGPYLVLLYGTAMTIGAFYYLSNWVAVAAMLVVWLSTLGLYVFMVVMGSFIAAGRKAAGLRDLVGKFR
ncbi:ribonuclease BN [Halosimplex aquaticum]